MSHIKLILGGIVVRIRNIISREISNAQCGFVADTDTRNAIFMTL